MLTVIVLVDGTVRVGCFSVTEKDSVMGGYGSYPAFGVINHAVPISFVCLENMRKEKGSKTLYGTIGMYNAKATRIANHFDTLCDHYIEGPCAFVFDNDDEKSREISKMMQMQM